MKIDLKNFYLSLSFLPLFLPNKSIFLILLLPAFIYFINKSSFRLLLFFLFSLAIGFLFFLRDYYFDFIDYSNLKLFYLFFSIFLSYEIYKRNYINTFIVKKILILYTLVNFLIIIAQLLLPNMIVWSYMVESEGQYAPLLGGRMFGLSGNPTHSGYLTMLITFFLITSRSNIFYIVTSFISVILLLNKMSIIILLFLGFLLSVLMFEKYITKLIVFIFGLIISSFIIVTVILPYFTRWADVGYETHTITYRVAIYNTIFQEFLNYNFLLLGDVDIYKLISIDAFDSLPALLIVKFGIIILFVVYFIIFFLTPKNSKNYILYLAFMIPSFTMVGFYNTLYIFPIFLLYFSSISALNEFESRRK